MQITFAEMKLSKSQIEVYNKNSNVFVKSAGTQTAANGNRFLNWDGI